MTISILTLFPELCSTILRTSITGKAQQKNLVSIQYINIRDFAVDAHGTVDDKPYGGGIGMILRVDVVHAAIQKAQQSVPHASSRRIILLDPSGEQYTQQKAQAYTSYDHLILVCGHYEGIDARILSYVDERCSIGPYILTGGEIPALVLSDSIIRLLPGVLSQEATALESFSTSYYHEPPQYTRPWTYLGTSVPEILRSGDHKKIKAWKASHLSVSEK